MQKTIFITVTKSLITRNILRSGVFSLLKKEGHNIVVFFQASSIPKDIKEEFSDSQVMLIAQPITVGRVHRRFIVFGLYLINTKTTRLLAKYRQPTAKRLQTKNIPKPSLLTTIFRLGLLALLSSFGLFRVLFRWAEERIFTEKNEVIQSYFDRHKPSLVFSTAVLSSLDIAFMKEASRRGIPTVSMPKSWDNVANRYYRFLPDYFLVQNDILKQHVVALQDISPERVITVGVPQFDWYCRMEVIQSRKEHFLKKGLDPERALVFFGSEGLWTPHDYTIAEKIYEWVINDELAKPCQLLTRPHYTNVSQDVFKHLRGKPKVVVDDFPVVPFLSDHWDQKVPDAIDFINSVVHCDVMINIASTLALDAACADRPIINLGFGCSFQDGQDVTFVQDYNTDHYDWVLATRATTVVYNEDELKKQINACLLNPELKSKEREILRQKLCYKVDGKSSERLAQAINDILQK